MARTYAASAGRRRTARGRMTFSYWGRFVIAPERVRLRPDRDGVVLAGCLGHDSSCPVHSPFYLPEGFYLQPCLMRPGEHNQGFRVENPGHTGREPRQFGQLTGLLRKVPACTLNHPRRESSSSTWPTARTFATPPETDSIASTSTPPKPITDQPNALLTRPEADITWAATIDEPTDTAKLALREALTCWFRQPSRVRRRRRRETRHPGAPRTSEVPTVPGDRGTVFGLMCPEFRSATVADGYVGADGDPTDGQRRRRCRRS